MNMPNIPDRPWQIKHPQWEPCYIVRKIDGAGDSEQVAECETPEIAAYIVRLANAHDALVLAMGAIKSYAQRQVELHPDGTAEWMQVAAFARVAIVKSEEP